MITMIFLLPVTLALSRPLKGSDRIAGVNQVSSVDVFHQPHYTFNASEARLVCQSLGLTIATKAQVQRALSQGFQTCRFGWIDEHLAVVPRATPRPSCGKGKTGLVEWRTSVKRLFDVFCFNESDSGTQLKDTKSDSPLTGTHYQENSRSPSKQDTTLTSDLLPSASLSSIISTSRPISSPSLLPLNQSRGGARPRQALLLGSTPRGSLKVPTKPLLIGVTCALLLVITVVLGLEQLNRSCFQNWDMGPQENYIETEENTCVPEVTIDEGTDDGDSFDTAI
ncbi:unnamed protein product [Boreogadus saida]